MPILQEQLVRLLIAERGKVLAYIRSIVRREDLAEDVFQEVSLRAIQKQQEINDEAHFLKWVRVASRLEAMNALRRLPSRGLALEDDVLEQLEATWDRYERTPDARLSAALDACLGRLSPAAQRIIRERYESGRSVGDLAKAMGRQVESLYVAISRIHRSLADCMGRRAARTEVRHG